MTDNTIPTIRTPAFRLVRRLVLILLAVMLVLTGVYAWPFIIGRFTNPNNMILTAGNAQANDPIQLTASVMLTPTSNRLTGFDSTFAITPPPTSPVAGFPTTNPIPFAPLGDGLIILSINQSGYSHLYAYQQQGMPLTRLTNGAWDDIDPALSPDGNWLAFASNRDGYWDIYQMNLSNGEIEQLTNTPQYDGSPSWSPDSRWLVYESYLGTGDNGNLEIFIQPVDGSQPPIQLTSDPGADHAPDWSPGGRQIAFISTRSGKNEVWLADLDQTEKRFTNISQDDRTDEDNPRWSPDGNQLAWSARNDDGMQNIVTWEPGNPGKRASQVGAGATAAWDPQGTILLAVIQTPNQHYLSAYSLRDRSLTLPAIHLPGLVTGVAWRMSELPQYLPAELEQTAHLSPTPPWSPVISNENTIPGNRLRMVELPGIQAPNPKLQDAVDEAFLALRERTAQESGWDFLGSLEQAYIPLSAPVKPGRARIGCIPGALFSSIQRR